ncbi:MAG: glycosyltransferase family 1 protein [Alphaproteobacteria bacterium]|nr:glycosyltransferase family 1 protein [Alphaproteobacteria bacterium]
MRVLLSFNGTRGDAQPLFALGRALAEAGHEPVLSGPPDFEAPANELGLDYRPRGVSFKDFMQRVRGDKGEALRASLDFYEHTIARSFGVVAELAREAELVVGAGAVFSESAAADFAGRPYVYLNYCPALLPSAEHPPSGVPWDIRSRWMNRLLWASLDTLTLLHVRLFSRRWRAQGARVPWRGLLSQMSAGPNLVVAADPELAPVPAEHRDKAVVIGALHLLPQGQSLAPELEAFLQAGPPPIYLGFGSMTSGSPGQVTAWGAQVAERLGCRVILGAGWAGLGGGELPEDVLVIDAAPHLLLFPRCAGAIHHGGAGTTAAALRSGVPQWVVPHFKDQYYFGHRVRRAGLGPAPVVQGRLSLRAMERGVAELLEDAEARARAQALGEALRSRDAAAAGVEALEAALSRQIRK